MTPFGAKIRAIRKERGITLTRMAKALGVSAAYLSALETGHRSAPSRALIHRVCQYLSIIWDEADELDRLAALSNPQPTLDVRGLPEAHIASANRLAELFRKFTDVEINELSAHLDRIEQENRADWKEPDAPTGRPRFSTRHKVKLTPRI